MSQPSQLAVNAQPGQVEIVLPGIPIVVLKDQGELDAFLNSILAARMLAFPQVKWLDFFDTGRVM